MTVMQQSLTTRLIFSTIVGTILEWYDFMVFAYMAPTMSQLFFPKQNPVTATLAVYSVFAVGFLIRPLGAIFFGHYGDRMGRKKMLVWSLLWISLATTGIGLLPTYQQIGMWAPVLLTILRLIQGFCIGGEAIGATAFILESYVKRQRGALGSLVWAASGVGMLLGVLTVTMLSRCCSETIILAWAWRVPFILGLVTGVIGYYIRRNMPESLLFTRAQQRGELVGAPVISAFKQHKMLIVKIAGLYVLSAMITYLIFVFMPNYAYQYIGIPYAQASLVTTIAIGCVTFFVPFAGWLSDAIGRKPCLLFSASAFAILSYPLFLFLVTYPNYLSFVLVESVFVLIAIVYQGVITAAVQEIPALAVRYSVTGIGYNLSYSIIGGTAPLVATYLVHVTANMAVPGLYLTLGSIASLIAVYSLTETAQQVWQ